LQKFIRSHGAAPKWITDEFESQRIMIFITHQGQSAADQLRDYASSKPTLKESYEKFLESPSYLCSNKRDGLAVFDNFAKKAINDAKMLFVSFDSDGRGDLIALRSIAALANRVDGYNYISLLCARNDGEEEEGIIKGKRGQQLTLIIMLMAYVSHKFVSHKSGAPSKINGIKLSAYDGVDKIYNSWGFTYDGVPGLGGLHPMTLDINEFPDDIGQWGEWLSKEPHGVEAMQELSNHMGGGIIRLRKKNKKTKKRKKTKRRKKTKKRKRKSKKKR